MLGSTELQLIVSAKDEASKTLQKVNGELNNVGNSSSFGLLKKGAAVAATAVAGLAAAATYFGVSSVKAFIDSDEAMQRFEAYLRNVTKASDEQIKALEDQQLALMNYTKFDDEAIASAQGFMASFQLTAPQIQSVTPHLLDMAEGLRDVNGQTVGLEQATNMLGKAIQLGNVTALQRVGVTVPGTTKAMQDLFKQQFQNADIAERVRMVNEMLDANFKDQAKAAGETLAGKIAILTHNFSNLKESVGKAIVEHTKLGDILNGLIGITKNLSLQDMGKIFSMAAEKVRGFFSDTNVVWVFIRDFFVPIIDDLKKTFLDAWQQINEAIQPVKPELKMIAEVFGVILLGAIMVLIKGLAELIKLWTTGFASVVKIFSGAIQTIRGLVDIIVSLFHGDLGGAVEGVKKTFKGLGTFFSGLDPFGGLKKAYNAAKDDLEWFKNKAGDIMDKIGNIFSSIDVGKGIGKAIEWIIGEVKNGIDWVNKLISGYNNAAKKAHLPTIPEIRYQFGGYAKEGVAHLVGEHGPEIFIPSQSGNVKQLAGGGMGAVHINFNNVSITKEADENRLVDKIKKALARESQLGRLGVR